MYKKYNFYYTGLVLCIQVDVTNDVEDSLLSNTFKEYFASNPIFGFETYNCFQHYQDGLNPFSIKTSDVIYLTFKEVNDMLEKAKV